VLRQQRLAADREDQDAEEAGHVLGCRRDLPRLEDVVEEEEVHGEKANYQRHVQYSSHGLIVGTVFARALDMAEVTRLGQCSAMAP
jgi:hypothetical protein